MSHIKVSSSCFLKIVCQRDRFWTNSKHSLPIPNIEKIGHNLKYDISILHSYGINVDGKLFDTMIAHYLIQPEGRHKRDLLARNYLDYSPIPITDLIGEKGPDQKSMRDVDIETIVEYAVEDADITLQLRDIFLPLLKEKNGTNVINDIEIALNFCSY